MRKQKQNLELPFPVPPLPAPTPRWQIREDYFEEEKPGAARHTDPPTSKAAAESVKANELESVFVNCLDSYGPKTAREVSGITGVELNSITPRMAPLRRKGFIEDSGLRRCKQIVWKLVGVPLSFDDRQELLSCQQKRKQASTKSQPS